MKYYLFFILTERTQIFASFADFIETAAQLVGK